KVVGLKPGQPDQAGTVRRLVRQPAPRNLRRFQNHLNVELKRQAGKIPRELKQFSKGSADRQEIEESLKAERSYLNPKPRLLIPDRVAGNGSHSEFVMHAFP